MYLAVWLLISLLFAFLYWIAYGVVINEIRKHAMGVAIATAAAIEAYDVEGIRSPRDMGKASFLVIQDFLEQVAGVHPDVKYVYVMRRSTEADALPSSYEYVVDMTEVDENENGVIDPGEATRLPGTPYDASRFPALQQAWEQPAADADVSRDAPYPDLLSGYAPVKDLNGSTIAVVGVDITRQMVKEKLFAVRMVIVSVWFLLCLLSSVLVRFYEREKKQRKERGELVKKLQDALLNVKTLRGLLPICSSCKKIRDDEGYWEKVEIYVSSHSEATFTHSLCPECLKRLYPEQYEDLKRKGLLRFVLDDPRK